MINEEIRLEGRKLYEDRKAFGLRKIVYPKTYKAHALHAAVDGSTHLIDYFGSFPRVFFTATQGTSGKSRATQLSYLFVKNPVMVDSSSGNGLIRRLNDPSAPLHSLLGDEIQDYWGPHGNPTIRSLLNSYTKGIPRFTADDKEDKGWISQSLFYPVIMNGLINKYDIPGNFLERCIQIQLPKKLPTEEVDDWVFVDVIEEFGDTLRIPFEEWAKRITKDDIRGDREYITKHLNSKGIHSRDVELFRPLCEYAYSVGDDAFDEIVAIALFFVENPDVILTNSEQLLKDFHEAYSEKEHKFISSTDLCNYCQDAGSIWKYYGKGGLTPDHLPTLLKGYKIRSVRNEAGQQRGFYANPFGEAWKRVLKLDIPDGLDGIDILCKMGTPLTTPPPILQNPSNTSSPSNPGASAMPSSAEAPTPLPSTITKKENMQTELQLPNTPAEWDELKERVLVRHSMLPEYVEKREQEEHGVSSDISNF